MNAMIYLKKILGKLRRGLNKIGSKEREKKLIKNFTLISNNCWAGLTYEYLNQPFISPTIGLYFMPKDYLKFVSNLKYYVNQELHFISPKDSKYYGYLKETKQKKLFVGKIKDIEIIFLHYSSEKDAKKKWHERCKKIDYNHIVYKFSDQNLCTKEDLEVFHKLKLKNKICFTAKKYKYEGFIQIEKYKRMSSVKEDIYSYHKCFDIIDYLNSR